jgi:two-component system chemotaxis sensor kinase CheA
MHPLVRRQLRKAGLPEVPDTDGLRAFVAAVDAAYVAADADRKQLEHSLNLASDELYARTQTLEQQLEERRRLERTVAQRNRDMALILDNVDQGFVTIGLDGSMSSEASRILTRWFGPVSAGGRIWSYLAGDDLELAAWIQFGFDNLVNPWMPREVVLGQLPDRIDRDGRHLRVEYQPIGQPLTALLVVVSDITDELARERAEGEQRELIAVVERAYRDRAGFVAFVREADALVQTLVDGATGEALQRALHTLKGNAALFGVVGVADACHALEDQMAETCVAPTSSQIAALGATWRAFHGRIDRLLGLSARRSILVDWDEYQGVIAQLVEPEPPYASRLRRWGQDPTRGHLERLADEAQTLAARLGKAPLEIDVRDHDLRLDGERFASLWAVLVHTVRNAVDHGLETAAARVAAGKPAHARMVMSSEVHGDELVLEITDDGAGIDWDAVAARARGLGLPAASQRDLLEALFASGMSTAEAITDLSGRGVGMGALRQTCVELGGRVQLVSERGRGTAVRCCVPVAGDAGDAAVAPPPEPRSTSRRIPRRGLELGASTPADR